MGTLIYSQSKTPMTAWDWHPKGGQSCGTESLMCGVFTDSGKTVSELNLGHPAIVCRAGELDHVGKSPCV